MSDRPMAVFALALALGAAASGCARGPEVTYTLGVGGADPGVLDVTLDIASPRRAAIVLRAYAGLDVIRLSGIEARDVDGGPLAVVAATEAVTVGSRTVEIPRFEIAAPRGAAVQVRYRVAPGLREGDAHMGFSGRCHGYLGPEFGFVTGRHVFLVPQPAESLRQVRVRFALPEGWEAVAPWAREGDLFRPGVEGAPAAEHLIAAAVGLGRFRERGFEAAGTRFRLAFAEAIAADVEAAAAARIEAAARFIAGIFGRGLGPEYLTVVMPKAPTGDDIAGEGWATGQGQTLAPATGGRLATFAEQLLDAYLKHAPYRTSIRKADEFWLVDGIRGLYAARAVAAAGLTPPEEVDRGLAIGYLTAMGAQGVEPDLETLYAAPAARRIEREVLAPFVLAHLDRTLGAATGGAARLDALVGRLFHGRSAPSLWASLPRDAATSWDDFRARYVRGRQPVPMDTFYSLTPTRPAPDPPAGEVARRLTILYTGETHGYLENCGCKSNQSGGVARRATALARLRAGDPRALLLDAGSAFVLPDKQRELDFLTRQEQALYLETMDRMGYQAAAIGLSELSFGLDYFRRQTHGLRTPFLVANVRENGAPIASGTKVLDAGGLRVGIIGVFEPPFGKAAGRLYEENAASLEVEDPIATLRREVPALRQQADLVVAMGRLTPHTVRRVADSVPEVDLILSSSFRAPARVLVPGEGEGKTHKEGEAHIHPQDVSGFLGRTLVAYTELTNYGLGSLRLGLDRAGRIASAEFADHWLNDDTPDDPGVRDLLNRFYDRIGREAAERDSVPPLFAGDAERLSGRYVGAARCAECHAAEHAQWRRTKHGDAYKTLLDRHRHFQPKCVSCHVVGFATPTGYRLGSPDTRLVNVQCEVCHGPGGTHVEAPSASNIRRAVPEKVCVECHNPEHSDHFVYAERIVKVRHDYYD